MSDDELMDWLDGVYIKLALGFLLWVIVDYWLNWI